MNTYNDTYCRGCNDFCHPKANRNITRNSHLDIVRNSPKKNDNIKGKTKIDTDKMMEFVNFVLVAAHSKLDDVNSRQKCAVSMRIHVSPIVANFFMKYLEQYRIATALTNKLISPLIDILRLFNNQLLNFPCCKANQHSEKMR